MRVRKKERKEGIVSCTMYVKTSNKHEANICDFLRTKRGHVSCIYRIIIFSGVSNVTEESSQMKDTCMHVDMNKE